MRIVEFQSEIDVIIDGDRRAYEVVVKADVPDGATLADVDKVKILFVRQYGHNLRLLAAIREHDRTQAEALARNAPTGRVRSMQRAWSVEQRLREEAVIESENTRQ